MRQQQPEQVCDYLIVGGGSAGCVLASRLSENPSARVILIEAGAQALDPKDVTRVRDARFRTFGNPRLFWSGVMASFTDSGPSLPFSQARILGGGSAINGMHCQRGLPADYDEWRQLGVSGWSWDEVVPFFKAVETDLDFANDDHGAKGPLRIRRIPSDRWSGLSRCIGRALEQRGIPELRDLNADEGDGYGAVPLNMAGNERITSADAYLTREVLARPNLSVRLGVEAKRILVEGGGTVGVEVESDGAVQAIRARETVLCMGAIHSPALLMRSGIGPANDLAAAGIAVVADRPGVGANLLNHPFITLGAHLRSAGRQSRTVAHPCPMLVRYSSNVPGCPPTDMTLDVWERTPNQLSWDPLASQIANLMILLNKVYSTGSVKLNGLAQLDIKFNLLSDRRDLDRMVDSIYFVAELARDPLVAHLITRIFFPDYTSPLVYKISQDNLEAQVLSVAGAIGLSGPAALRNKFLDKAGRNIDTVIGDREAVRALVAASVVPGGHVAGTCRMGDPAQRLTVTDSRCRVVGLNGLRVVDTSIFPTLMAAGTNLPVMMAAEKAAKMISEDARA